MEHRMRLVDFAFNEIKCGNKDIELRLYDEKRRLINVGDTITFEHVDTHEEIKTKVKNLYITKDFKELFDRFDNKRFGLKDTDDESLLLNFYTLDDNKNMDV